MKTFKQYFIEDEEDEIRKRMKLTKEYALFHRGKWIIDTFHKLDREFTRGKFPAQEKFFKNAIDWLIDKKKGAGIYLFLSKSSYLGMVIEHRKDKKGRVKGKNLIIITWLGDIRQPPINKKSVKDVYTTNKSDIKVILEYIGNLNVEIDEVVYV